MALFRKPSQMAQASAVSCYWCALAAAADPPQPLAHFAHLGVTWTRDRWGRRVPLVGGERLVAELEERLVAVLELDSERRIPDP